MDDRTAANRLRTSGLKPLAEDGRSIFYDPRAALPVLFGVGAGLNPAAERARLDAAKAELAELELAKRRGELIDPAEAERILIALFGALSQRLQAIPRKAAPELAAESSPARCELIVEGLIHEALHDVDGEAAKAAKRLEARAARREVACRGSGSRTRLSRSRDSSA
jgi:hypothetical protein